jgi:hypothetical protein
MAVQDNVVDRAPRRVSLKTRVGLVLVGFLIIAGGLLFTEHRAHVLGLLVWLPVLACPLMHVLMHGGHGHHHGNHDNRSSGAERRMS